MVTALVPSLVPASQGALLSLNIQFPSPAHPREGVQHRNEPAGLPVPCAGGMCLGGYCQPPTEAAGSRGEERYIPQHVARRQPWGPGSPPCPLAASLRICLLQRGVQLSPHLSPGFGCGQELLPLPYPHPPPPLKHHLACSWRGVACRVQINNHRAPNKITGGWRGAPCVPQQEIPWDGRHRSGANGGLQGRKYYLRGQP